MKSAALIAIIAGVWLGAGASAFAALAPEDITTAIMAGNLRRVEAMLDADPALLNAKQQSHGAPLHAAARFGTVEMIRMLIARGADLNARAYNGFTPLHLARSAEAAQVLLKAGADPNLVDSWGKTPLQTAANEGRKSICDVLLAAGVKVDLTSAIMLKRIDLVKQILKDNPRVARAKESARDLWGSVTPVGLAAGSGDLELVKLLIEAGFDPNEKTFMPNAGDDATAVSEAVWGGHREILVFLLEHGARPEGAGGKFYDSILDYAIRRSSTSIVELLLKHGALDHALQGSLASSNSLLAAAATIGDAEKVELLLASRKQGWSNEELRRALFLAASEGHDGVERALEKAGAVADIYTAAVRGDEAGVMARLSAAPELLNAPDPVMHRPVLSWAIVGGRREVALALLAKGADPSQVAQVPSMGALMQSAPNNEVGPGGWVANPESPLLVALRHDARETKPVDAEIALELLKRGADPNVTGSWGNPALLIAVGKGAVEVVKEMLARGANPDITDRSGRTPLHAAAYSSTTIAAMLLDFKANPNATASNGERPIDLAAQSEQPGAVELLLNRGATLTMFAACRLGKHEWVRNEITANPESRDRELAPAARATPLEVAAAVGQLEVCRVLLDAGADPQGLEGSSKPLNAAATAGQVEVIRLLMDRGARIDEAAYTGTAVHAAAQAGQIEALKFLISRGGSASSFAPGRGWTPLHAAAWGGNAAIVKCLVDAGAKVDAVSRNSGWTPLIEAATRGNLAVAEALVQSGADVTIRDSRGDTALDWALRDDQFSDAGQREGRAAIARLLRSGQKDR